MSKTGGVICPDRESAVCSPDMEVSFKPLAVCLSDWTTILQCGFASVHLKLDSYMRGC